MDRRSAGYGAVIAAMVFYFGSAALAAWLLRDYRPELPIVLLEQANPLPPDTVKETILRVPRDGRITLHVDTPAEAPRPRVHLVTKRATRVKGTWEEFDVASSFTIDAESPARRSGSLPAGKYLLRLVSTHPGPEAAPVRIRVEFMPGGAQPRSGRDASDAKRTTASIPSAANRSPTVVARSDSS